MCQWEWGDEVAQSHLNYLVTAGGREAAAVSEELREVPGDEVGEREPRGHIDLAARLCDLSEVGQQPLYPRVGAGGYLKRKVSFVAVES